MLGGIRTESCQYEPYILIPMHEIIKTIENFLPRKAQMNYCHDDLSKHIKKMQERWVQGVCVGGGGRGVGCV